LMGQYPAAWEVNLDAHQTLMVPMFFWQASALS
jgi:hypothetical protein